MKKLRSDQQKAYKIIDITRLTHDTSAFRFQLPERAALDFLPGDHLIMYANVNGQSHARPYTPSSTPDDVGFFEIIVKRYHNGLMSNYIHSKKVGNKVLFSGPIKGGHFKEGMAEKIGMIAGGSGITPMIAIIRTTIRRRYNVQMYLLFANKTEEDIILHNEFEQYANHYENFHCQFVLDKPSDNWKGAKGYIDEKLISQSIPAPDSDPIIFLCGPPMMEFILQEKLLAMGYEKKRLIIP